MASALIVKGPGDGGKIGCTREFNESTPSDRLKFDEKRDNRVGGNSKCNAPPRFRSAATPGHKSVPKVSARAPLLEVRHTDFARSEFVERLKERDQTALTELVDAYLPQLLHAGRGMGFSREESEDLAQSVFTAFIEGVGRFEGRSHLRTFLFGIFYRKVSEHLRDLQRARQFDPIDEVMEAKFDAEGTWRQPPVDIEKQLLAQEAGQIIQDSLEEIPQAQRIVFYLREVEEMETAMSVAKWGSVPPTAGSFCSAPETTCGSAWRSAVSQLGKRCIPPAFDLGAPYAAGRRLRL
jgi:RNA polymerase sigma-70 factor, ECF subfamily